MLLKDYFTNKPHGAKAEFARKLGITKTWLSLIMAGTKTPSAPLSILINDLTNGKVKLKELRPDIFKKG
jgi:DNA-binding transcriptional regulator YdaS (Cro superfamily)